MSTERPVRLHMLLAHGDDAHPGNQPSFAAELRRLAELRHCAVAPIIDGGTLGHGGHFVVQDGIGSETLAAHLARAGLPSPRKVERLMMQALDALGAAHRLGLVHRALSMKTLIVCLGGLRRSVAIVDLGIVRLLEASLGRRPGSLSSVDLGMQAPKFSLRGSAAANAAGDVYSWAMMMRELLGADADSERWAPILARATATERPRLPSVATVEALLRGDPEPDELAPPRSDRAPSYQRIDDAEVLLLRLEAFTRQAQWVEAIEVLVRLCELEPDPLKAAKHALSAGMLIEGELGDGARALRYYRLALERCPEADRAFEVAEKLLKTRQDWNGLDTLYRDVLASLNPNWSSFESSANRRLSLLYRIGKLARDRFNDRAAARAAFAEAAAMRPDDPKIREALASVERPLPPRPVRLR